MYKKETHNPIPLRQKKNRDFRIHGVFTLFIQQRMATKASTLWTKMTWGNFDNDSIWRSLYSAVDFVTINNLDS